MTISALLNTGFINNSNNSSNTSSGTSATDKAQEKGFEYMQLLITQLENQNPLEPMDTQEITNQLMQQAQLEQQINTNDKLDDFISKLDKTTGFSNLSYIGNTAEILSNEAPIQDGSAKWAYVVDGVATDVELTVTDADGSILYTQTGTTMPGAHEFTFDAALANRELSENEGVFLFVSAIDQDQQPLNKTVTSFAKIDGVDGTGAADVLTAGSLTYDIADVLKMTAN